jgi:hypothetical protein
MFLFSKKKKKKNCVHMYEILIYKDIMYVSKKQVEG